MVPQISLVSSFDTSFSGVGIMDFLSNMWNGIVDRFRGGQDGITPGTNGASVPELDMTVAGSAIVLILGGVAYMASRRRREQE